MNILKAALSWLLTKHAKKEQTKMSKIVLALSVADGVVADGLTVNTLSVTATDDSGIPLVGSVVLMTGDSAITFSASNLTTDANGVATTGLTASAAGIYQATALLTDGTSQAINVTFLAQAATAVSPAAGNGIGIVAAVEDETEAFIATLKKLVAAAGSQAHAVFDDLIDLAKKLK